MNSKVLPIPAREAGHVRKLYRGVRIATAIEYGLIAALISVAIIATINQLGKSDAPPKPTEMRQPIQ